MIALVISDLHTPFQHPHAVDFLADLNRLHRPDLIVCVGDEADLHRWSSHPQLPELPGPADELERAVAALKPLYKLFPRVMVCNSNHVGRWSKRAAEAGFTPKMLKRTRTLLSAPKGWRWADTHDVGGVHYRHGDGFGGRVPALTAAERLRRRVVMGHVHTAAGAWWSAGPFDVLWGLQVGCLVDPASPAFAYGKWAAARPVLGCGLVADGVPAFIPLRA